MAQHSTRHRFTHIKGGLVIDPDLGIDSVPCDVLLEGERVADVGESLTGDVPEEETVTFDAAGRLVCPGLVDLHVHCFPGATPIGVSPDECCLRRGVTTVVDAGSAGASTFEEFNSYCGTQLTNILAFVHASRVGLSQAGCSGYGKGGELDNLDDVDELSCLECIESYKNRVVGIKIRLSDDIANDGKHEFEAYRRALTISSTTGLPLMVHHTLSTIPLGASSQALLGCPGSLQPGDIYTHTFHAYRTSIINPLPKPPTIDDAVVSAKKRGVIFDVGHGQGSFSWTVAEMCAAQGFWPDTISSDMHAGNVRGPAYDLTTVMTKLLHVGMPLYNVIKAVTSTPASAIRRGHEIGSLAVGRLADITVLDLVDCDLPIEDCQSQMRRVKQYLSPVAVWRKGCAVDVTHSAVVPNDSEAYLSAQAKNWARLVVRDSQRPLHAIEQEVARQH